MSPFLPAAKEKPCESRMHPSKPKTSQTHKQHWTLDDFCLSPMQNPMSGILMLPKAGEAWVVAILYWQVLHFIHRLPFPTGAGFSPKLNLSKISAFCPEMLYILGQMHPKGLLMFIQFFGMPTTGRRNPLDASDSSSDSTGLARRQPQKPDTRFEGMATLAMAVAPTHGAQHGTLK